MRMRRKKHLEERIAATDNLYRFYEEGFFDKKDFSLIDFKKVFENDNPIELEVGAGKGSFIIAMAEKYQSKNFVAVEKLSNVIVSGAEEGQKRNLKNLAFFNLCAEYFPKFFAPDSVSKIYLLFSCPYPKNTYKKRRLTHANFLKIYEKLLIKGGLIIQKTDNKDFFDFSREEFIKEGFTLLFETNDLHNENLNKEYSEKLKSLGVEDILYITTEYEEKFIKSGLKINALVAVKNVF